MNIKRNNEEKKNAKMSKSLKSLKNAKKYNKLENKSFKNIYEIIVFVSSQKFKIDLFRVRV